MDIAQGRVGFFSRDRIIDCVILLWSACSGVFEMPTVRSAPTEVSPPSNSTGFADGLETPQSHYLHTPCKGFNALDMNGVDNSPTRSAFVLKTRGAKPFAPWFQGHRSLNVLAGETITTRTCTILLQAPTLVDRE